MGNDILGEAGHVSIRIGVLDSFLMPTQAGHPTLIWQKLLWGEYVVQHN